MSKKCTKCQHEKAFADFHKNNRKSDGLTSWCKACSSASKADYYKANKERVLGRTQEYKATNSEKVLEASRQRSRALYWSNPEHTREAKRKAAAACPHRAAFSRAAFRSQARNAMPAWADRKAIMEIYAFAAEFRRHGFDVHVDHIIPLNSDIVCGLHVPANLRVCLADVNVRKGNKPDASWYA